MTSQVRFGYTLTAMAAALLAVFGAPGGALADEVTELTKPESGARFGLGYVDEDNQRFGQYNGMNEKGGYGLLDADIVKRDDATGTWLRFRGTNLGLENRGLRFEHEKQGDWGYFIDYSAIPRYEPYTVTTGVTGIGTPNLNIPTTPTAGSPFEIKTERERVTLGFNKYLPGKWNFKLVFRDEQKEGARVFARGTTGGAGNFEFAPEPIDSTTRQIDATFGYNGEALQLTMGYYGTTYDNKNTAINFTGGVAALSGFTPIGLPPDNQSHQFYVAGGYNFTPTTRGNFKFAYARAEQDDLFVTGVPLQPGVGTNLQGRVDTTRAQLGIVSRPMPKLTLNANLRYEDRDDKTPVLQYGPTGSTTDGTNEPRSIRTTFGSVEGSYALPAAMRVIAGLDYEEKERNTSPIRIVSYRETTDETTYRLELRRSMSETLSGAIGVLHADRGGSPFLTTTTFPTGTGSNVIAPIHLADRTRDTVRLTANWQVADPFSLQFRIDQSQDEYEGSRDGSGLGPREADVLNLSVDAAYNFNDEWTGTAWVSQNESKYDQSTDPTSAWQIALKSAGQSYGLGLRGKFLNSFAVGADLTYSDIEDEYKQTSLVGAAIPTVPDVSTQLTRLNLFLKYALAKNQGLRLDYIYDQFKTDDWTWTSWNFTDGTRLTQNPDQKVNFVGVSYYFRFQ